MHHFSLKAVSGRPIAQSREDVVEAGPRIMVITCPDSQTLKNIKAKMTGTVDGNEMARGLYLTMYSIYRSLWLCAEICLGAATLTWSVPIPLARPTCLTPMTLTEQIEVIP